MTPTDIKEYDQRLARHDWHWEYSDDAIVRRGGQQRETDLLQWSQLSPQHQTLWRGYCEVRNLEHTIEPNTPGRKDRIKTALRAAQLAAGVVTQAELDEREAQVAHEQAEAVRRRRYELQDYDLLCSQHDWRYWHHEVESDTYQRGAAERRELLKKAPAHIRLNANSSGFVRLFRAWAAWKNAGYAVENRNYWKDEFKQAQQHYLDLFEELKNVQNELLYGREYDQAKLQH